MVGVCNGIWWEQWATPTLSALLDSISYIEHPSANFHFSVKSFDTETFYMQNCMHLILDQAYKQFNLKSNKLLFESLYLVGACSYLCWFWLVDWACSTLWQSRHHAIHQCNSWRPRPSQAGACVAARITNTCEDRCLCKQWQHVFIF